MVEEDLKDWNSMCHDFVALLGRDFVENIRSLRVVKFGLYLRGAGEE